MSNLHNFRKKTRGHKNTNKNTKSSNKQKSEQRRTVSLNAKRKKEAENDKKKRITNREGVDLKMRVVEN